jgi:hypothetical protein
MRLSIQRHRTRLCHVAESPRTMFVRSGRRRSLHMREIVAFGWVTGVHAAAFRGLEPVDDDPADR